MTHACSVRERASRIIGARTIDLQDLKERFNDFGLDWPKTPISRLRDLRNDLEHFHLSEPLNAVKEAIAQSFPMVVEFFKILGRDPAKELGEAWPIMLNVEEFFNAQKEECNGSLRAIQWPFEFNSFEDLSCPNCRSTLIEQIDPSNDEAQSVEGRCRSCGASLYAEDVAKLAVEAQFGAEAHSAALDGDYEVIGECPGCGEETYVKTRAFHGCAFCGDKYEGECERCHTLMRQGTVAKEALNFCRDCWSEIRTE